MSLYTLAKRDKPTAITGVVALLPRYVTLTANTQLAALDPSSYANGHLLGVSLPTDSLQWWKIRALVGGEVAVTDGLVVCASDTSRCWVRIG